MAEVRMDLQIKDIGKVDENLALRISKEAAGMENLYKKLVCKGI